MHADSFRNADPKLADKFVLEAFSITPHHGMKFKQSKCKGYVGFFVFSSAFNFVRRPNINVFVDRVFDMFAVPPIDRFCEIVINFECRRLLCTGEERKVKNTYFL